MYVHIGKDEVVNSENIIAILDINSLEKKNNLKDICKSIGISDNIIDVSDNNKKTLIVIQTKDRIKGCITNISSTTIAKRMQSKIENK